MIILALELLPVGRTRANRRGYIALPYPSSDTQRADSQTILNISFQFAVTGALDAAIIKKIYGDVTSSLIDKQENVDRPVSKQEPLAFRSVTNFPISHRS